MGTTRPAHPDHTDLGLILTVAVVLFTMRVLFEQSWLSFHREPEIDRNGVGLAVLGLACLWSLFVTLSTLLGRSSIARLDRCLIATIALCGVLWAIPGREWRLLTAHLEGAGRVPSGVVVQAAGRGEIELLEFLLSHDANPNARTVSGQTALGAAAAQGQLRACELLVVHGAFIDGRTAFSRQTPLMEAAMEGHPQVIKFLLARGANVALRGSSGLSARDWAAQLGDERTVQLLDEAKNSARNVKSPVPSPSRQYPSRIM